MRSLEKHTKKDAAVSPVVGVMLMLVVTIIIAAVVALFATGVVTNISTPSTAVVKLDSYTMGSVNQTLSGSELATSYKDGWYDYGSSIYGSNTNYAPYKMVFQNMGGSSLSVANLQLLITFNGATYTTPFSDVTSTINWDVGDKVTLAVTKTMLMNNKYPYGLSQQSMAQSSPTTFTWAIKDASNNVIAQGTEATKWTQNNTLSITASPTSITSGNSVTFYITNPGVADGTTVTLTASSGATLGTASGTMSGGSCTITSTVTGSAGTVTVTATVGGITATCDVTISS